MSNFLQRTLTGALFLVIMIGGIVWSYWSMLLLFFIISMLGLSEFYKLAGIAGIHPQKWLGMAIGAVIFFLAAADARLNMYFVFMLGFPFIMTLFFTELYRNSPTPFQNIAFGLLGIIYVLLPFAAWTSYLFPGNGIYNPHILLGFFFILWTNDTGAYIVGSPLGKHKLWERISPKKSWEGFIGGMVFSLAAAYLISHYFTDLSPALWMILAFVIIVFGTLGDLVKSMFKRSINIKDSGNILPGHGGILDRFDGLLLSTPFVLALLYIVNWVKQMM